MVWNTKRGGVQVYNGNKIPFDDKFFDFTISESVIDSMTFELAKKLIKEIDRVTKKYFFVSLISSDSNTMFNQLDKDNFFVDEVVVEENHEKGTIQSFFDMQKIKEFIKDTTFKISWCEKHIVQDILNGTQHGRYYLLLEKE